MTRHRGKDTGMVNNEKSDVLSPPNLRQAFLEGILSPRMKLSRYLTSRSGGWDEDIKLSTSPKPQQSPRPL